MRFLQRTSDLGVVILIGVLCALFVLSAATADAAGNRLSPIMKYVLNGGDPPGKPLAAEDGPDWLHSQMLREQSVVATSGSHRLITYRVLSGADENLCFVVDDHLDGCAFVSEWKSMLAEPKPWYVFDLYVDVPAKYREALHGIVDSTIAKVRVDYPSGPAQVISPGASGGLIVPLDLGQCPERIVGLNSNGKAVVREEMTNLLKRTGSTPEGTEHSFPDGDEPGPCVPHAKKQTRHGKHVRHGKHAHAAVLP